MGSSPGPWTPAAATTCIVDAERNVVCDYVRQDDAKLIAAAPEMATMLKSLEWCVDLYPEGACPECGAYKDKRRHFEACRLAALLSELP